VIGAGGLGSPAAMYLAASGVGRITLVDDDEVDLTNLQRQVMHTTERVGQPKVDSGREALAQINPDIEVTPCASARMRRAWPNWCAMPMSYSTAATISPPATPSTAPAWRPACRWCPAPRSASTARCPCSTCAPASPCYACLFPPTAASRKSACSTMGVFAPLVGIVGAMQAAEALKLLAGSGRSLAGRLLLLDGRAMEWTDIGVARDPGCPVCGSRP
jgi:molybdopterin/thiamine biosynthesis adenylyltransferase